MVLQCEVQQLFIISTDFVATPCDSSTMELNSVLSISGEITAEPVEREEQRLKEAHRAKIMAKTRKKSSIYFTSHPHFNDRSISFHNVSYVIKPARTFLKNSTPKVILCNVRYASIQLFITFIIATVIQLASFECVPRSYSYWPLYRIYTWQLHLTVI